MLDRRNNRSLTSPATAAVTVPPTAADATAATAASYAAVAAVTVGSFCAGTDKAVEAETSSTPAIPHGGGGGMHRQHLTVFYVMGLLKNICKGSD
jgi:hypothetical protein